jgi:hypothetical protein
MTGNKFRPDIVERVIDLIGAGETDLRAAVGRGYALRSRRDEELLPRTLRSAPLTSSTRRV